MSGISLSILIIYLSIHHSLQDKIDDAEISGLDNNFDIIVFSQEWPVTVCKDWIHNLNGSECVYPTKSNQWAIHGIWPSAAESKTLGPHFCNESWAFDPEQIKSIEAEMEQAWVNIYKGIDPFIFWAHEWLKHGTCATKLEAFNSQIKYFSKGIEWHQKYYLLDMFDAANIFPNDTKEHTAEEFIAAVKLKTGKDPMVTCNTIDDIQYLAEMSVCFNKQLNLIDCPVTPILLSVFCDVLKGIVFPANA